QPSASSTSTPARYAFWLAPVPGPATSRTRAPCSDTHGVVTVAWLAASTRTGAASMAAAISAMHNATRAAIPRCIRTVTIRSSLFAQSYVRIWQAQFKTPRPYPLHEPRSPLHRRAVKALVLPNAKSQKAQDPGWLSGRPAADRHARHVRQAIRALGH